MKTHGKRFRNLEAAFDAEALYETTDAVALVKKNATAKFNETIEIHVRLGVDPKKSDQNVRGTVSLPHGTGRSVRVIAFARGDKLREAEAAGADFAGENDLVEKVKAGFTDFDVAVATPNIGNAIRDIKAGKVEYRLDKTGIVHTLVGKANFDEKALAENINTLLDAIVRAKPSAAKGTYLRSITIASTMGPGVKIDPLRLKATAATA